MNRKELIAAAKAQWTKTEASVAEAAKGDFEKPDAEGWSAGDCYRHIIDTVHRIPDAIDAALHDQPVTNMAAGDPEGIARFKSLTAKTLPVEMNTAHGKLWMALQKLQDSDLDRQITVSLIPGATPRMGDILETVILRHEQGHAEQALKAAGVAVSA